MDGQVKYLSAAEEEAELKIRREKRAQAIEGYLATLPEHRFKAAYLAAEGAKTVTVEYLSGQIAKIEKRLVRRILEEVCDSQDRLQEFVAFQRNRCRVLEAEVAELKAGGPNIADCYRGVWMYGSYKRGSLVTHSGSIFLALKDTDEKPATSDAWKLIVKAGRDGKDAR
jgi:hypothetical protein